MKTILLSCFFLVFIGFSSSSFSQIQEGSYAGMMQLVPTTLGMDSVPVKLDIIQKSDTVYQLIMTYDSTVSKDYKLIIKGDELLLDENNGIQLPGNRIENTYVFHYAVNEKQYHTLYEFMDNTTIHFKLTYFTPANSVQNDDFTIQGYKKAGHQYVLLRKIK